ncbi:hypothetical protein [Spiroplasma taiwanense]|uniref:DUF3800 domain-containing protein n=1 Tax=Spiroplasma taiwanense CT-1 TaxID=1276220 RepID=S5LY93_9MOLU|nr:hypothetical protein [Spiroplasma taiwanense]AGR41556.1 hypothetical protein STAIW_v1c09700 [Spiroplasma taiwanense CT-1]
MNKFISEKIYITLDESGKLNQNDIDNYFIVGGFFTQIKKL